MKTSTIAGLFAATGLVSAASKCKSRDTTSKPEVLEPAQNRELGAQRLKFRYGPLLVPGVHDPDTMGMKEFQGFIQPPCTDCYITHYQAGLEFEDGTNANAHTGMWLHHTVLFDLSQQDPMCEEAPIRLFASGNERSPIDLSINGTRNAGIYLPTNANVTHVTELMNESALSRTAFLTTDIAWDATFAGEILATIGHLHDGGLRQDLQLNGENLCQHTARYGEAAEFITHVGMYGNEDTTGAEGADHDHGDGSHSHDENEDAPAAGKARPGTITGEADHDHGAGEEEGHTHEEEGGHDHGADGHITHISSIRNCDELGRFAVGDEFSITSFYNFTLHPAMAGHHGGLEPVMGITILYALKDEE
ncbi:unnamed protein product [Parascedosporium putredinis]|uniref:Uncharacterized protein n=1 Tax=Parascedosporium putredinis TaxID=1442378 RepID=A0A9P1MEE8_9PEZI|nr:unnamed protein product [Parascedosporium putredinis]CAI8004527.1 unnamed protein product [Parascedosporium putredinis]